VREGGPGGRLQNSVHASSPLPSGERGLRAGTRGEGTSRVPSPGLSQDSPYQAPACAANLSGGKGDLSRFAAPFRVHHSQHLCAASEPKIFGRTVFALKRGTM